MMNYFEKWIKARIAKREKLDEQLKAAKEQNQNWKVIQVETKLKKMDSQDNPKVVWNSSEKGTYRNPERAERKSRKNK